MFKIVQLKFQNLQLSFQNFTTLIAKFIRLKLQNLQLSAQTFTTPIAKFTTQLAKFCLGGCGTPPHPPVEPPLPLVSTSASTSRKR